jgi:PGF-CTERM protein
MRRNARSWTRWGLVFLSVFVLSVTAVQAVAAQPTIDLTVDGQSVTDGQNVTVGASPEVDIAVSSSEPLEFVDIRTDGDVRSVGYDSTEFRFNHSPAVSFGRNRYAVTAATANDRTTVEVWLEKPASTREELQAQIRTIRQQIQLINDTNRALQQEKENLTEENRRLRERLNESDGGSGNGQPGFTAVVALLAAIGAVAIGHRRR